MIHARQSNFQDSILLAFVLLHHHHHVIIPNYMYRIFLSIFHRESGYKFLRLIYFILNTRSVLLLYKDQVADFYALYRVHCVEFIAAAALFDIPPAKMQVPWPAIDISN